MMTADTPALSPASGLVALARIGDLRGLGPGWDGYGAAAVAGAEIAAAVRFVLVHAARFPGPPEARPMTRGGVRLEWHRDGRSLELGFLPTGRLAVTQWATGRGFVAEGAIDAADEATIADLLDWAGGRA
jgi:hypothetical protein